MNDLLKALADHDRELEAPEAVELRLKAAFRKRYARRIWRYFALAAAAVLLAVFLGTRPEAQTMTIAVAAPPVPALPVAVAPAPKNTVHRQQSKEVVTGFFALMDPAPPFDRGQLLRVSLPASAMRSVGLPVSEEHLNDVVQADVLVGEEGLARAVRFVKMER